MPINWDRLCRAMQHARLALRTPRETRREITRNSVGRYWSDEGSPKAVPINLLGLYDRIVVPGLIGKNPRLMLSTFKQEHKPVVSALEDWVNPELERMNLARTLQRCVLDALTFVGVCKVALATPADAALLGWQRGAGQPFAERIDLDDFVFDLHARDFTEVSFIGHRYRAPIEVIRKSKMFSRERFDLAPSTDEYINPEGDERISTIGRTYLAGNSEEFEDMVDLWEVYLPRHRVIVTLADDHLSGPRGGNKMPLRVQRWLGPDCGPYHLLGYGVVPGNIMFKGPKLDLFDMHLFLNRTYRKLMRQADRQKNIGMVRGSASEDGTRTLDTDDGEFTKVDDPAAINMVDFGGPNQNNFAMFMSGKELFSWMAGNLDMLGGLAPQSKTATQDEILAKNATGAMSDMQTSSLIFTESVGRALLWFHHHHPTQVHQSVYKVPGGGGIESTRNLTPKQRQRVPFDAIGCKVDPYSLSYQTPQMRLQALMQTLMQVYVPLAQQAQQQGVGLDMNKLFQKIGRMSDDPTLEEVLSVAAPVQEQPGEAQQGPTKPPDTTRTYERISRPGRTDQGYAATQLMNGASLGGGSNGSGPKPRNMLQG